ncbi:phosphate propanoyltransferase [bacterium]|nr:phosphate propanoyltransferase [bacterium]
MKIPIEVSARHIHIKKSDLEKLFGIGYKLHKLKELSQKGNFSSEETVELVSLEDEKRKISNVRIVGPCRNYTQIELSLTDAYHLKIKPPIRKSGDLDKTPGIKIIGPKGELILKKGVIIPKRHIHISDDFAKEIGLKENDVVKVKVKGERGLIFEKVAIRIDKNYTLTMHIDTDEGNAAGIDKIGEGELIVSSAKRKTQSAKLQLKA